MSHIDSSEAMLGDTQVATNSRAWRKLRYRMPAFSYRTAPPPRALPPAGWSATAKRSIDIAVALLALALLVSPLLLVVLAIKLESRGPVLFRQRRIGLHGRPFELLKFRTMHPHPADRGQLRQTSPHDPRVTRAGALLRHTSIDELPQLWNVLRGEMSLVGPRPHAPGTCAGVTPFEAVNENYPLRHCVRPGMTGLAQVRGWRGQTDTEEKLLRRLDCDLEYIATWSLWLDILILTRTAATVLRMRNAY